MFIDVVSLALCLAELFEKAMEREREIWVNYSDLGIMVRIQGIIRK